MSIRDVVALSAKIQHKVSMCRVKFSSQFILSIFFFAISSYSATGLAQGRPGSVTVTGEASVEITDYFETDTYTLQYFIIDLQSGARTEVFMPGPANGPVNENFRTGNIISVHGSQRPNGRDIDFQDLELLEVYPDNIPIDRSADAEAPVATPVTREVLTLLVDFNDAVVYDYGTPGNTPNGATLQNVKDRMFNETKNVAHFYDTASLGTLTIPSAAPGISPAELPVYGPYQIDLYYLEGNPGSCSSSSYVSAALDMWEAATGQSRSSYKHHSLILPNYWDYDPQCTFGGQAQLGCGDSCWAVSMDPVSIMHGVIIHELGHNFDFNHARTDTNNDGSSDCEYCDSSDFMGGSRNWMKFNPPHFEFKGWHDPDSYELHTITPTSTLQEFQLIPVDEEDTEWPGLRALKTTRTASTNYYFSFRQETGHYDNVTSSYTTGVSLHWRDSTSYSYFYRMIAPGEVFVDVTNNLVVYAVGPTTIDNVGETDTTEAFTLRVCNTTCATLLPPVNLVARGTTPNSIELSWSDHTYNEDGFTVESSPDGSSWSTLATVAANATSYLHSGLSDGSTFYYRVRAYRVGETSDWSNTSSASTLPASGSFGFRIQTGDDDVEEFDSSGSMWLNSSFINLGLDSSNGAHDEGLRFQGVAVPQGANVNSAYIEYRAYDPGTGATSVTYRTEDVNDAAAFTSTTNNLTSRTFGAASVNWVLSDWSHLSYYQSPDLKTIIQPIVNKAGWSGGNSMVFVSQGVQTGSHKGLSYDGHIPSAPLLVIDYTWTPPATCSYSVTQPVGGETWTAGTTYSVNWNKSGANCAATALLHLHKGGAYDSTITASTSNDGSYSWTIPADQATGSDYRVFVVDSDDGTYFAQSSGNFTINAPVETCNVNMVSGVTEYFDASYEACEILVLGPDFIAGDGSNVSVNSGWEINFLPGFIVEQGATLNANVCGQSLCMISPSPMLYGCHSCVDQICDIDASCCGVEFDDACLDMVDTVCGLVCE